MLTKILDFFFGKDPEIFNHQGKVEHKLPRQTWEAWENRFKENPEYNWRLHSGQRLGKANTVTPSKKES